MHCKSAVFNAGGRLLIGPTIVVALSAVIAVGLWERPARSETQASAVSVPADFARDPLAYYFDEHYREALRYGEALLGDPDTPTGLRTEVLVVTATIYLAQRKETLARQAFLRLLADDPTADLAYPERLPRPVTRLFYRMRDSVCSAQFQTLIAAQKLLPNLGTIAIGDIENNSLVASPYNLDHLCRGLVHVISNDLQGATDLKVVDRQRLSILLQELGMSKESGTVDPEVRVRTGRLCGAQSFLFGQFMQVDKGTARMDLRWVNTATGENLLSEGIQAKVTTADDLFGLERRLVVELMAPRIQRMLDSTQGPGTLQKRIEKIMDQRRRAMPNRNAYAAWIEASGRAVTREDAEDLEGAISAWRDAQKLNPADSTASWRVRTISAFRNAKG